MRPMDTLCDTVTGQFSNIEHLSILFGKNKQNKNDGDVTALLRWGYGARNISQDRLKGTELEPETLQEHGLEGRHKNSSTWAREWFLW